MLQTNQQILLLKIVYPVLRKPLPLDATKLLTTATCYHSQANEQTLSAKNGYIDEGCHFKWRENKFVSVV